MSLSRHWRGLIGATLLVLAAAHLAPRFVPAPDLDENRTLAPAPAWPRSLGEAEAFRLAADRWIADRFPPRAQLIGALNWLRLQIGASGSPRVITGRDGWLFYDDGSQLGAARGARPLAPAETAAWLQTLAGRREALAARGAAYLVVSPPDKEAVYPDLAPAWFRRDPDRPAVRLDRLAQASGAGAVLYLQPALERPARWGLKTYSAHDTHWTGLGAWVGYAALMRELKALGVVREDPRPLEAFEEVQTTAGGVPRNLALMLGVASFVPIDYPQLEDPADAARLVITPLTERNDWTAPRVIDTGQTGKPVLLMTLDSFSNALMPFLYGHFSRIITAHNQDGTWREDLIARFDPDVVILEVVESGLPNAMGAGPQPSATVAAAIARTLSAPPPAARAAVAPRAALRTLEGGAGPDRLSGGEGPDRILGLAGDDVLEGGGGEDLIRGGRGDDALAGGDGRDWLSGDRGDDVLTGGPGADIFHSSADAGIDRIEDFDPSQGDRVLLEPGTPFRLVQEGPDAVVLMSAGRVVLQGLDAASLPPGAVTAR